MIIAGVGFATMAWKLAQDRSHNNCLAEPGPRWTDPHPPGQCPHCEYYRIIDRAEAEWWGRSLVQCETVKL